MMRGFFITACLVAVGGIACAASYDDFTRGTALSRVGKNEEAITAFTAALAPGDLAATYVPAAYFGRAQAYAHKGFCAEAEADLTQALKLRPAYLEAVMLRASVRDCLNKYEDARTDLDAAVNLSPTVDIYRTRGQFYWRHAKFDTAAADYLQAFDVSPKNSYYGARRAFPLLWYAVTAVRAGTFDAAGFAKRVDDADVDGWPAPLLGYFTGKVKLDDVYAKAARGDGEVPAQQKCETDFYIGEWQIGHGDTGGKGLLQKAAQECPRNFIEYHAAQAELKRLP